MKKDVVHIVYLCIVLIVIHASWEISCQHDEVCFLLFPYKLGPELAAECERPDAVSR